MPRTENGEIDRAKLMELGGSVEPGGARFGEPRSEIELRIAQLWKEVLNVSRISINDTFFELGGDSLSAMSLTNRLCQTFGIDLSVRILFEMPTIQQLALALSVRLGQENKANSRPAGQNEAPSARELLNRIDEIPDQQVDALLEQLAGNEFVQ